MAGGIDPFGLSRRAVRPFTPHVVEHERGHEQSSGDGREEDR